MLAIVSDSMHDEAYSKDEICHLLDTSEGDLAETSLCCGTISGWYRFGMSAAHPVSVTSSFVLSANGMFSCSMV